MMRAISLFSVMAMIVATAGTARADTMPSASGVCGQTDANGDNWCSQENFSNNARFNIDPAIHGGGGNVITMGLVDGETNQYRWDKGRFVGSTWDTKNWWGFEAVSEWDRYPLPWGNEVYEAKNVPNHLSWGRETLLLSSEAPGGSHLIYSFEVPKKASETISEIRLQSAWNRYLRAEARPDSSSAWTGISFPSNSGGGAADIEIPLAHVDQANGTFQVKIYGYTGPSYISGNLNVVATTVPEPVGMAIIGLGGILPLMRRRRR